MIKELDEQGKEIEPQIIEKNSGKGGITAQEQENEIKFLYEQPRAGFVTRFLGNCVICEKKSKYKCPQCQSIYCSSDCYKQHNENCKFQFENKQMIEELKLQKSDKEDVKKMQTILYNNKAMFTDSSEQIQREELEEKEIEALQQLLQNVENLDVGKLNQQQKESFTKFIRDKQNLALQLGEWVPWWRVQEGVFSLYVEEVEENSEKNEIKQENKQNSQNSDKIDQENLYNQTNSSNASDFKDMELNKDKNQKQGESENGEIQDQKKKKKTTKKQQFKSDQQDLEKEMVKEFQKFDIEMEKMIMEQFQGLQQESGENQDLQQNIDQDQEPVNEEEELINFEKILSSGKNLFPEALNEQNKNEDIYQGDFEQFKKQYNELYQQLEKEKDLGSNQIISKNSDNNQNQQKNVGISQNIQHSNQPAEQSDINQSQQSQQSQQYQQYQQFQYNEQKKEEGVEDEDLSELSLQEIQKRESIKGYISYRKQLKSKMKTIMLEIGKKKAQQQQNKNLGFHFLNILYSVVFSFFYFNGESLQENFALSQQSFYDFFLQICECIGQSRKEFLSEENVFQDVQERAVRADGDSVWCAQVAVEELLVVMKNKFFIVESFMKLYDIFDQKEQKIYKTPIETVKQAKLNVITKKKLSLMKNKLIYFMSYTKNLDQLELDQMIQNVEKYIKEKQQQREIEQNIRKTKKLDLLVQ